MSNNNNNGDGDGDECYNEDEDLNHLLQIDNQSWLSEKPISVLQLDPADRAVLKIAGNYCK